MWLVLQNKLLTVDILRNQGFQSTNLYAICQQELEPHMHVSLLCHLYCLVPLLAWPGYPQVLCLSLRASLPLSLSPFCIRHMTLFRSIIWVIWQERNTRIFENKHLAMEAICHKICFYIELWLSLRATYEARTRVSDTTRTRTRIQNTAKFKKQDTRTRQEIFYYYYI